MGILNRVSILFRAKVMGVVDRAEDPRETLAYACQRQEELLANVRRALVEVTASRHQLAAQIQRIEQRIPQLEDQASRAVAASREDLARQALERRQLADRQLADLRRQLEEVSSEEQKLRLAERRFASAVEAFAPAGICFPPAIRPPRRNTKRSGPWPGFQVSSQTWVRGSRGRKD